MKKKALIYALLASVLVGTVASCDDKNNNNNNIVNVDPTPKEDPKKEEPDNPKKEEPETPKYNFEDNEESKKVYEEFSKYFTNVSYEDFLLNAKKSSVMGGILFEYKELSVTLNFDGSLKLKSLIAVDGNKKTDTEYKYLNNEWVKTKETLTLNGKELITYSIGFNVDDSYYCKDEYTYDDNGNQLTNVHSVYENDAWVCSSKTEKKYDEAGSTLTLIESRYLNNEWVKISEYKYINGEEKSIYSVYVDNDGKITGKNEYTYDENGNELSGSYFKYLNNEWIEESGFVTINGERKRKRDVYYKDGILNQIHEYTYDESGNQLTEVVSSLINNEWIIISESKRINGELKPVLYYLFNDDGSISSKTEQTYDEFGNTSAMLTLKYLNNTWVNDYKSEFTYDESGKEVTRTYISYENNELDSKQEYVLDGEKTTKYIRSKYINNAWLYESKNEYKYDENGSQLGNNEYIYLNNQWIKKNEYKYIEGKIKRVYSLNLNEDNTFNFKTEYTYDSKGNELSSISSSYKNNNWILSSKEEYEYDEAGNELGNKRYNYISNQWVKVYEDKYFDGERKNVCTYGIDDNFAIAYIYENILDEDGKEIKSISIHIVDNELSNKTESTEDEYGNLNSVIYYDYDNGSWIATSKFEKTFDSNGKLLENIQYKSINGELKKDTSVRIIYKNDSLAEKEEYKHDETGKVLSITYSKYVNNDWTLDSKTEYTYDEKGKELTFDSYKYIKDRWIRCSGYMFIAGEQKTTCNYSNDETGKLTAVIEYKYDDKGDMISMTTIHFKDEVYDSKDDDSIHDGKIVERVSSKYNGYYWVENKKIEYEYDTDGKQLYEAILVHINNGWIKTQVLTYINGNSYETYSVTLTNAGYIDTQVETKYDTNGNQLSETTSQYINGKLEKILEYVFINEKKLISCKVDSNYAFKEEYEYDENGNEIVYIYSRMALNNWYIDQRREYKYHPNGQYSFTAIIKYEDNKYFSKEEIEQDEKGNVLNRITSQYENDAWNLSKKTEFDYSVAGIYSLAKEYKFINGSWIKTSEEKYVTESDSKQTYEAYITSEGKYDSECFWDYYDSWNKKTYIRIEFKDGIYSTKNETTYDEIGNELIYDKYMYISNIWIKTYGYYYSSKEKITTCIMLLNEDGLYDRTINDLYENGILTRSVCVLFENNEVKEEVESKYDENKNLMSETHSNLENGNWVYASKDEHTYDSNGKKLTKTHLKYISNFWIEEWKYEYTYDEYGMKETYYIYENNKWVKVEPSSSENKVVHKKEDVQEGVYKIVDEVYDKNDKLISASEIYYWNEKPSKKTEITYNDDENVAYAIAYDYVNDEWVLFEKYEFSYNEKAVSTGLIISNYVNDAWLYRTKQEYIYDANGNKIEEHDSKYVNGKWIVCEKLKKINGQEQLKLYYNLALNEDGSFNNQWESEFDENGREILTICQDYVNNEWVYTTKFESTYNETGAATVTRYIYENGQWVLDEDNQL